MGVTPLEVHRGDVFLVALDPTVGREIRKTRPCVVLSPDELNEHLSTVVVAPMTTGGHPYPFRLECRFQRRNGFIVIDQLRTVDARRLVKRLGGLDTDTIHEALGILREMFAQ